MCISLLGGRPPSNPFQTSDSVLEKESVNNNYADTATHGKMEQKNKGADLLNDQVGPVTN